jgi:hypothetical protein
MKKIEPTEYTEINGKKKLILRKESIRALDDVDLTLADGAGLVPPDGGNPPPNLL